MEEVALKPRERAEWAKLRARWMQGEGEEGREGTG